MFQALLVLSLLTHAYAKPNTFKVKWECPRTIFSPDAKIELPAYADLDVTYDQNSKPPSLSIPGFDNFPNIATNSKIDYFDCMEQFKATLKSKVGDACLTQLTPKEKKLYDAEYPYTVNPCDEKVANVLEPSRDKIGAIPPKKELPRVFPMEKITTPYNPELTASATSFFDSMKKKLSNPAWQGDCYWNGKPMSNPPSQIEKSMMVSSEFVDDYLPKILSDLDAVKAADSSKEYMIDQCKRMIFRSYFAYLSSMQKPEYQCPLDTPECKSLRGRTGVLLRHLEKLYPIPKNADRDAVFDQVVVCVNGGENPALDINGLAQMLDETQACVSPAPGEAPAVINQTNGGKSAQYTLQRATPADPVKYVIGLNLNFDPAGNMKDTAAKCLERANKLLWQKTPAGVEKMEIKLVDKPDDIKHTIKVSNVARMDMDNWADENDPSNKNNKGEKIRDLCPSYTHEMLHVLGLCDEYKEKVMGYTVDATGKASDKMVDKLFCTAEEKNSGKYTGCVCSDADMKARKKGCIVGFDCRVEGPEDSVMNQHTQAFAAAEKKDNPRALLYPGEWKVITQPGCKIANKVAYSCMSKAYSTSSEASGSGCGDPADPACKGPTADNPKGWLK